MRRLAALSIFVELVGCTDEPGFAPGQRATAFVTFEDEAADRGLIAPLPLLDDPRPCLVAVPFVASSDLDGDGDPDLVLGDPFAETLIFRNDDGQFEEVLRFDPSGELGRQPGAAATVDLDGDGLPELVFAAEGLVTLRTNLGNFQFGPWTALWEEPTYPHTCVHTLAFVDLDGDGDLDLVAPGADRVADADVAVAWDQYGAGAVSPSYSRSLWQRDGGWFDGERLGFGGAPGMSLLAFGTDRDADGDVDVYLASDRIGLGNPPAAFYRNDAGALVDDAAEVGADLFIDGMGVASADLNDDGLPDWCMTTTEAQLRCLLSQGGGWAEAGTALGLVVPASAVPADGQWWGWSVDLADLDADGWADAIATSAYGGLAHADALWRGGEDGFEWAATDFSSPANHGGMAVDDFDGDGCLDAVVVGGDTRLWRGSCPDHHWIEVDPSGPAGNRDGLGAVVRIEAGGRSQLREIHGLRGFGQSRPVARFGLGDVDRVDRIEVSWPGGARSVVEDVAVDGVVVVPIPDGR